MDLRRASKRVVDHSVNLYEAWKKEYDSQKTNPQFPSYFLPKVFLDGDCRNCGARNCRFNITLDNRLPTEINPNGFQLRRLDCEECEEDFDLRALPAKRKQIK